jgi:hypothetical protein
MNGAANGPDENSEETIFSTALRLSPGLERAAYLEQACAGRDALRQRVETLLRASPDLCDFMEHAPGASLDNSQEEGAHLLTADAPEEWTGTRIGRYKLLQKIGEGGCGVVYMAEQEEPVRRRVALKVIKLGMDTKSVIARFEAERQALAMMDHPNIAKVLALRLEARNHALGIHAKLDHLQGDPPADRFLLLRHIHHPAAAFADLLEQLVAANPGARPLFRRDGQSDCFRGARRADVGRVLHEFPELGLRFEEFLDPLAQCGLSGTRLVKVWEPARRAHSVSAFEKMVSSELGSCSLMATPFAVYSYMRKSAATTIIGI